MVKMKILYEYAEKKNLKVVPIRYRHQFGYCLRRGYDLVNANNRIFASFEPIELSDGTKWHLRNGQSTLHFYWFKRISKKVLNSLVWEESPDHLQQKL